MIQKIKQQKKI